jgi:hypothetical protein
MARLWYRCDLCRRVWPDDGPAALVSTDTDISTPAN